MKLCKCVEFGRLQFPSKVLRTKAFQMSFTSQSGKIQSPLGNETGCETDRRLINAGAQPLVLDSFGEEIKTGMKLLFPVAQSAAHRTSRVAPLCFRSSAKHILENIYGK